MDTFLTLKLIILKGYSIHRIPYILLYFSISKKISSKELNISSSVNPKEIEKQVVEVSIERKALKEKFDSIVRDFTQYEKLERHAEARRQSPTLDQTQKDEMEL